MPAILLLLLFEKKVIKDSWQSRNIMQNHVLIEKKNYYKNAHVLNLSIT